VLEHARSCPGRLSRLSTVWMCTGLRHPNPLIEPHDPRSSLFALVKPPLCAARESNPNPLIKRKITLSAMLTCILAGRGTSVGGRISWCKNDQIMIFGQPGACSTVSPVWLPDAKESGRVAVLRRHGQLGSGPDASFGGVCGDSGA
jgi:hypothetical protein